MCRFAFGSLAMFKNLSRIKLMRRILSFHGFLLCLAGFLCACRALGLSRIISLWAVGLSARSVQRKLHPTRLRLKKHPCQSYKSVFEKKLSGETNTDYKDWTDEKISINKGGFYKFPPSKWLIIVCWRFAIFWILFGSNCKLTQSRSSLRSLFNLQFNLENNSKIWQS